MTLGRFVEARYLLRKTMPMARRHGEDHRLTLKMQSFYAQMLYEDPAASLDDLRESVTTFEDTARTARRVLGGAHPLTVNTEDQLQDARAALAARDPPPRGA